VGVQASIRGWLARKIPHLQQQRDILETYFFSKLWFLTQILPIPDDVVCRLTKMPGSFL
jgi:valyl-tRNA synthetase